jgi:hypothetical protein
MRWACVTCIRACFRKNFNATSSIAATLQKTDA